MTMPIYNNNNNDSPVRTNNVLTLSKRFIRCRKKLLTLLLFNTLLWFFLWCNAFEIYYQMTVRITPQRGDNNNNNNKASSDQNSFLQKIKEEEDKEVRASTAATSATTTTTASPNKRDVSWEFEAEMEKRREQVQAVCSAVSSSESSSNNNSVVNYRELFLQKEQGLAWCPVFKGASTTWMTYFIEMSQASKSDKEYYRKIHFRRTNEVARELYPRIDTAEELREFYANSKNDSAASFMIIRHPFHRLVSAFRDKLEKTATVRARNDYYYKLYGQKIVSRYREKARQKFGAKFFNEQNNFGTPVRPGRVGFRNGLNPTFWEFVQFVKDAKSPAAIDIHWQPMSTFCSVCSLEYDYYLKFESMAEEEALFLESRNLTSVLNRHWMNPNKPTVPGLDQDELTKKYFEQLDDEDIMALYKVYEMDFKMFDYKFEFRNIVLPL